ncbi:MAG: hypothetical protein ACREQO_19905 [Candidatus Binatia bacterium]
MQIFATRAGIELERTRADEALKASEHRLQTVLDRNNAIVTKLSRDELLTAIAAVLLGIVRFDR